MFASQGSVDDSMSDQPGKNKQAKAQEAQPGMRVWMPVEDEDVWALATVTGKSFGGKVAVKRSRAPRGAPRAPRPSPRPHPPPTPRRAGAALTPAAPGRH